MGFLDAIFDPGASSRSRAKDTLGSVKIPDIKSLQIKLEELTQAGILSPEEAQTISQGPSAYETIQSDPRLRGSQVDALGGLERTAAAGGLDAMALADLEDALGRQRTESRGQQGAIMANARARGIGGSDLEMVNRMIAQQQQATAGSRAALDTAAIGQQRKDAALRDSAQLAGNIRGQDYTQAADKAAAADAISRFNAANRQDQTNLNVGARNTAQQYNLNNKQDISDQNVGLRNEAQKYNKGLPLDIFKMQSDQASDRANMQLQDGQAKVARNNAIKDTLMSGAGLFLSDERQKENVQPIDSRKILGELTGSTYDYKSGGDPGMSVMAQDLERTPLAPAVKDTPAGKMVDQGQMPTMALLADLNKRLEALGG